MSYSIIAVPKFIKELKRLVKKYPSLKTEFSELAERLTENPRQGVPLGKNCYKIRISIQSKSGGKRGGARIVTHFAVVASTLYLLAIYDKSEVNNLSDKELKELLDDIPE